MKRDRAFSLVEVTLALGITAFCLIGLFGLLPVAMNSNRASLEECNALNVMNRLVTSIQALPANRPESGTHWKVEGLTVPNAGDVPITQTLYYSENEAGQFSTAVSADAAYRLTVTMTPPEKSGASLPRGATRLYIRATWPADIDPSKDGVGFVESFTAINRQ